MSLSFPRTAVRLSALAALAILLLFQTQASRAQLATGTLNGEMLFRGSSFPNTAFVITNLDCTQGGVAGFDFTTSGTASGPYPGTFTESGSVTFENAPSGPILSFSSQFTITSGAAVITGTKQLAPNQPPRGTNNRGNCQETPNGSVVFRSLSMTVSAQYTAAIPTATGTITETGTSRVNLSNFEFISPTGTSGFYAFEETYRNVAQITAVAITPAAATNLIGTTHAVTATATNAAGAGITGAFMHFEVIAGGETVVTTRMPTQLGGHITFIYQGPQWARSDTIRACADRDDNGRIDPTDPCATATKEWVFPASTPGQSTGGGRIFDAATGGEISVGLNFSSVGGQLTGSCTVNDREGDALVKCLDVLSYVQTGNAATVYGTAEVNGAPTFFKIVLADNDTSGAGADTFAITTQSGYTAGGVLTQGNIQMHAQ